MQASRESVGDTFLEEVSEGRRFEFGKNWRRFLSVLTPERIAEAERSLARLLGLDDLTGRTFLDVGSGSGLFSLAARRLGARVHSFDYDPDSVSCTTELRRRYFPADESWTAERGSVLDPAYLGKLQRADVVYSWGVLHHTGKMWDAVANAADRVGDGGLLAIALYNDQGLTSRYWHGVKRLYCSSAAGRAAVCAAIIPYFVVGGAVADLARGRSPFRRYRVMTVRGMSPVHDWFDWLGGLPFEVARPADVVRFLETRGFTLVNMNTVGSRLGCNEFVFRRTPATESG